MPIVHLIRPYAPRPIGRPRRVLLAALVAATAACRGDRAARPAADSSGIAPVAPAPRDTAPLGSRTDSAPPAAAPNAASELAPTAANARAIATRINATMVDAGKLGQQHLATPALQAFAGRLRRDHEAQVARLENIPGQPALTPAQREAVGRAVGEQERALAALPAGSPAFDARWLAAVVASHERALADLRALAGAGPPAALGAYVRQLAAGVQAHLADAQRLQTRPGSSAPAR